MRTRNLIVNKVIVCVLLFGLVAPASFAHAAISNWQKGATIVPGWNGEFSSESFRQSLRNLVATKANYVTFVVPLYQSNAGSTDLQTGWNTPSDESLISAITYAHSLGLRVVLKPHVDLYSGDWRAYANPWDRNQWFANYTTLIMRYVDIAAKYNVEDFTIGSELISLSSNSINSTNTQNWRDLISKIRARYTGKLTYSANWGPSGFNDEKNNILFWDSLDYIGISAYYNLNGEPSVANMKNQWDMINNADIGPISRRYNKPVVFTEVGYRSVTGSHREPWNYSLTGAPNEQEQANAYQALFEYWNTQSFMEGVQLWHWMGDPNAGGSGATDYTPQRKLAEKTMATWFSTNSVPPPSTANPHFSVSAQTSNQSPVTGEQTNITTQVTNTGEAIGNIVVDVEIYNSANTKVFQKYYDLQGFAAGQTRSYTTSWTPTTSGNYTVKIGIFNVDWSYRYLWVNNAQSVQVGNSTTTPPPPTTSQVEIWWPTQGSSVGGKNVPFKALLKNSDVNAYNMYWQVDSGALITMPTNYTDYPHKQFDADLTGWTWKGSGPYKINFVAQDRSGTKLGERNVDITVWQ